MKDGFTKIKFVMVNFYFFYLRKSAVKNKTKQLMIPQSEGFFIVQMRGMELDRGHPKKVYY